MGEIPIFILNQFFVSIRRIYLLKRLLALFHGPAKKPSDQIKSSHKEFPICPFFEGDQSLFISIGKTQMDLIEFWPMPIDHYSGTYAFFKEEYIASVFHFAP